MRRFINFVFGFVIGGLLGGVLAIILAPSSGKSLRGQIQDSINRIQEEVKLAASERRAELEQELERLRQPIVLE